MNAPLRLLVLVLSATPLVLSGLAAQAPPLRLTFAEAVARASATPSVVAAAHRADGAAARADQTRSATWPAFNATAAYSNRSFNRAALGLSDPVIPGAPAPDPLIGPFDLVDARLYGQWTVLDLGARGRARAADASALAASAGTDRSADVAASNVAFAYLDAARAAAVLAARLTDSALAHELVDLARQQRAADVATGLDVTRAETQLVTATGALVVARNQGARASVALARALGLPAGTAFELADTLRADLPAGAVPDDRDALIAAARRQRPDLAVRHAETAAARAAAAAVGAERLPRLDVTADVGLNGPDVSELIPTHLVSLQVSLPLLDELRRRPRLAEREAAAAEAEVLERDLAEQVGAEVDVARYDLASAQASLGIAAEGVRLASLELAQAREKFAAGAAGNLELIAAQVSLLRARDTEIDARYGAAVARVVLARAAGVARTLGAAQ